MSPDARSAHYYLTIHACLSEHEPARVELALA